MAIHPALTLATIDLSGEGGVPRSTLYDDVYHSFDGGLGQSRFVFLQGNCLPQRWQERSLFTILETGFGLGLNFLTTWAAWRADAQHCRSLHFISLEKHPFSRTDLQTLHQQWPELAPLAHRLQQQWPLLTPGFHRLQLDEGVTLTLIFGDALQWLPQLEAEVDAFYLDGFSPGKNPELWGERLLRQVARLADPEATCATYTIAAAVRRGLATAGFTVEKWPGYGGKRDMLHGHYSRPRPRRRAFPAGQRALVIGAGIAGSSIAQRLAARGWQLSVFDRQPGPGLEASGNRAGILQPVLSLDDNLQARLSRACLDYGVRHLPQLPPTFAWGQSGVLQLARDAEQEQRQRQIIETLQLPPEFARFVNRQQASALSGQPMPCGGWWFAGSGWLQPAALCATQLGMDGIETFYSSTVARIAREGDCWRVYNECDTLLGEAPHLILANAADACQLIPQLPLHKLRRQVSHLAQQDLPALDVVLCRDGYLTPALDGIACLGASRDDDADGLQASVAAHHSNLHKLAQLLPGLATRIDAATLSGRVGYRPTTPDRLPLIGAIPDFSSPPRGGTSQLHQLPRLPGLYGLLGFGARGLTWAPLAAELLASQLCAEPLPLERELVAAVDPGRFWLRELRQLT